MTKMSCLTGRTDPTSCEMLLNAEAPVVTDTIGATGRQVLQPPTEITNCGGDKVLSSLSLGSREAPELGAGLERSSSQILNSAARLREH